MDDPNWADEPTFEDQVPLTWQERLMEWGWLVVILVLLGYFLITELPKRKPEQVEGI